MGMKEQAQAAMEAELPGFDVQVDVLQDGTIFIRAQRMVRAEMGISPRDLARLKAKEPETWQATALAKVKARIRTQVIRQVQEMPDGGS